MTPRHPGTLTSARRSRARSPGRGSTGAGTYTVGVKKNKGSRKSLRAPRSASDGTTLDHHPHESRRWCHERRCRGAHHQRPARGHEPVRTTSPYQPPASPTSSPLPPLPAYWLADGLRHPRARALTAAIMSLPSRFPPIHLRCRSRHRARQADHRSRLRAAPRSPSSAARWKNTTPRPASATKARSSCAT